MNDSGFLNIQLNSSISDLDEVVVTALNIKKSKERIGYAVQEVEGEDLVKAQEPNVVSNLTGKVAGLTVFNSTDFFANPGLTLKRRKSINSHRWRAKYIN